MNVSNQSSSYVSQAMPVKQDNRNTHPGHEQATTSSTFSSSTSVFSSHPEETNVICDMKSSYLGHTIPIHDMVPGLLPSATHLPFSSMYENMTHCFDEQDGYGSETEDSIRQHRIFSYEAEADVEVGGDHIPSNIHNAFGNGTTANGLGIPSLQTMHPIPVGSGVLIGVSLAEKVSNHTDSSSAGSPASVSVSSPGSGQFISPAPSVRPATNSRTTALVPTDESAPSALPTSASSAPSAAASGISSESCSDSTSPQLTPARSSTYPTPTTLSSTDGGEENVSENVSNNTDFARPSSSLNDYFLNAPPASSSTAAPVRTLRSSSRINANRLNSTTDGYSSAGGTNENSIEGDIAAVAYAGLLSATSATATSATSANESGRGYGSYSSRRGRSLTRSRVSVAVAEANAMAAHTAQMDIDEYLESRNGQRLSKKDRNKLSAMKYRKKRKLLLGELEEKVASLEDELRAMDSAVHDVDIQNQQMRAMLTEYQSRFGVIEGSIPVETIPIIEIPRAIWDDIDDFDPSLQDGDGLFDGEMDLELEGEGDGDSEMARNAHYRPRSQASGYRPSYEQDSLESSVEFTHASSLSHGASSVESEIDSDSGRGRRKARGRGSGGADIPISVSTSATAPPSRSRGRGQSRTTPEVEVELEQEAIRRQNKAVQEMQQERVSAATSVVRSRATLDSTSSETDSRAGKRQRGKTKAVPSSTIPATPSFDGGAEVLISKSKPKAKTSSKTAGKASDSQKKARSPSGPSIDQGYVGVGVEQHMDGVNSNMIAHPNHHPNRHGIGHGHHPSYYPPGHPHTNAHLPPRHHSLNHGGPGYDPSYPHNFPQHQGHMNHFDPAYAGPHNHLPHGHVYGGFMPHQHGHAPQFFHQYAPPMASALGQGQTKLLQPQPSGPLPHVHNHPHALAHSHSSFSREHDNEDHDHNGHVEVENEHGSSRSHSSSHIHGHPHGFSSGPTSTNHPPQHTMPLTHSHGHGHAHNHRNNNHGHPPMGNQGQGKGMMGMVSVGGMGNEPDLRMDAPHTAMGVPMIYHPTSDDDADAIGHGNHRIRLGNVSSSGY